MNRFSLKALQKMVMTGAALLASLFMGGAYAVTGAAFTTVNEFADGTGHCQNGNPNVNCNIYTGKSYVWLDGGPLTASLGDGTYLFAVLVPSGQGGNNNPNDGKPENLSDIAPTSGTGAGDAYTNRTFTIANGVLTYGGTHDLDHNKIRLMGYDTTTNPGGVYILAVCSLGNGDTVKPRDCKYDAFKVLAGDTCVGDNCGCTGDCCDGNCGGDSDPKVRIGKDASGTSNEKWTWNVSKSVDKTIVKQVGGKATFTYTVTASHDSGTITTAVTGTITVTEINGPNVDYNSFADTLPGLNCIIDQVNFTVLVDTGVVRTVQYNYSCSSADSPPSLTAINKAQINWTGAGTTAGDQVSVGVSDEFTYQLSQTDECATVTDAWSGDSSTTTLGTLCYTDSSPKVFASYSRTVNVPSFNCVTYTNTAVVAANDTGAGNSVPKTVTVCGPVSSGGLTMGFWQNPNGQAIITGQNTTKTAVCASGTWLNQYMPFKDLSATANCAAVATYVTNVIKAANASGAAMNAMLKGQMLATALDVYFSDPALGGNKIGAGAPIGGLSIDLTQICKNIAGGCTIFENTSAAFNGASSLTVSQLLACASGKCTVSGCASGWYSQVKATQELAKDTFDAINNQKAFAP